MLPKYIFSLASNLCLILVCIFSSSICLAAEKTFRAGAATSDITSPLGSKIIGGFVPFPSTRVHDPLNARCLVLDDGTTKLAIVVLDLLGIARHVSDEARIMIEKESGIPATNVLISATHTHSAASVLGQNPRVIKQTLDEYQKLVVRRIAEGVKKANDQLRPAEIAFGNVEAPEHVFNRRWFLKDGTMPLNPFGKIDRVKMNPGAGNPDLIEPAGPTDPTASFFFLREPKGKPIALFSSYSLHYVGGVGNGDISSDYYGVYCEKLKQLLNPENQSNTFVVLMANGTSGDINNINFKTPRGKQKPYEQMTVVADDLAAKVFDSIAKLKYEPYVTLGARFREPLIGLRRPDSADMEWVKQTLADPTKDPAKGNLSAIYAQRISTMAEYPEKLKMPLQVLRIGDRSIATMPCEIFCEIGLEYKKKSPVKNAWMISLAHGYYGYLPSPRHHELGGYETWMGTNRLEKFASDKMLAELLEMTAEVNSKAK